ncbi:MULTISPECIES: hypothetical protein [Legionella]|uniref:CYTH domain-containing protein n=1 Tax=Legionella resiliens TaxID=2905958 RepID=A0ABS8X0Z7_9GAMM|nr:MULTISPECIES: hypothetical protein [unclassified Legionella]MCE0721604.1 hypothetical protein [Legionella sp. 9fVS26]MCE3530758.1 hypothetical protein [Legionella sp. 8cVS16]QLZ70319.1 hypothetical protein FOLKNPGA_03133 [Legionella sp. PC1000]
MSTNQRLVWNFEFAPKASLPLAHFVDKKDEQLKWEIRYFWPDDEAIILNTIDNALLELANYKQKIREDYYYLLPGQNYNIKKRRDQLLYKPLLKQINHAVGYGRKITLERTQDQVLPPELQKMIQQVEDEGIEIFVKKEALIYKFPTEPKVKIELARLEVLQKIYFSVCIEGKSLQLVETISKHLLDEPVSCEYVAFLKNLMQL